MSLEDHCGGGGGWRCVKREELSQLLHDKVLAGTNGGHLSSDGVHIPDSGQHGALETHPNMRQNRVMSA